MSLERKHGLGWPEPKNHLVTPTGPTHGPTDCKELLPLGNLRAFRCPTCSKEYEREDGLLPAGFVTVTCAGNAVLESVEP